MQFILPLQEDGVSQRHTTTLHIMLAFLLFGIGAAGIGLYWFTTVSPAFAAHGGAYSPFIFFGIASIIGSIAILTLSVFQKSWMMQKRNNLIFRIIELVLLAISSVLFFMNHWNMPAALFGIMALVVVLAVIREKNGARAGQIIVSDQGIRLRNRALEWKEVTGVLLRFGTLTVELNGNKMIQQNLASPLPDAAALERFSQEKIEMHKVAMVADEW